MTSDKDPHQSPYAELGRALHKLRTQRKWSLREAAENIGLFSYSRLRDFERGTDPHSAIPTRPTEEQLRRIARAYEANATPLLRLAGYSAVGPLDEWEETLIKTAREISTDRRPEVLAFIESLRQEN